MSNAGETRQCKETLTLLPPLGAEKAESGERGGQNHAQDGDSARTLHVTDLVPFGVHAGFRPHQENDTQTEQNNGGHPQEK